MFFNDFRLRMDVFSCLAAIVALTSAVAEETPTNTWLAVDGGLVSNPNNWQDGRLPARGFVLDYTALANGATVKSGRLDKSDEGYTYAAAGLVFSGADGEFRIHESGCVNAYNEPSLGYFPFCVPGGTLYWKSSLTMQDGAVIRKTGAGTLALHSFSGANLPLDWRFEITDGVVSNDNFDALWSTHVVVKGNGRFVAKGDKNFYLGAYDSENGDTFDLAGNSLSLGANNNYTLSPNIVGTGRVRSIGGTSLVVTNISTDITYVARDGDLRFDRTGMPGRDVIGCWSFEDADAPGRDMGVYGNDLLASNGVTVVEDPERGRVAYLARGAALYGQGAKGSIRMLPSGSQAAYTFSYWMKTVPNRTSDTAALFFWGPLPVAAYEMLLNRLDTTAGKSQLVFGHSGSPQWVSIPELTKGKWVHIAITFDGSKTINCYTNGVYAASWTGSQTSDLKAENFSIGRPWSTSASWFEGYLDDVVFITGRLDDRDVYNRLYAVRQPKAAKTELSSGTKLETTMSGTIYLAGTQTVETVGGRAIRGGVRMTDPGQLTLTGDAFGRAEYTADIAGPVDIVKDGAGTALSLRGPISTSGKIRVKAGTLALARDGTESSSLFARYDFEHADNLGLDTSGRRRDLTNQNGVTQVEDPDRGKVAKFVAASSQTLGGVFPTDEMSGNSEYTFSVWAKVSDSPTDAGSFVSFGQNDSLNFHQVQFRFRDYNNREIVLAHWGGSCDFTGIPAPQNPTTWHHYVAVRKENVYTVYCDGKQVWTTTKTQALDFQLEKKVYIGSHFASNAVRFFDGLLDDVRIYGVGLDATNVARLYAGNDPVFSDVVKDPTADLPKPVLHYAFEDAANLGRDSSGNGFDLVKGGSGTLTQGESILPGKALQFDETALSYLQDSGSIPSVIPQDGKPYTVSFWLATSELDAENNGAFPTFLSWGDVDNKKISYMMSYWFNTPYRLRCYVGGDPNALLDGDSEKSVLGFRMPDERVRWHHIATVYDPNVGIYNYIDGQKITTEKFSKSGKLKTASDGKRFFLGLKTTATSSMFRGKLDEVKIYNVALNESQIRLAIRAELTPGCNVLPRTAEVAVDADATLAAKGGTNEVAVLTGAGTVAVSDGARFAAADLSGFTGKVTGAGRFLYTGAALPEGATVESTVEVSGLSLRLADAGASSPLLTTTGKVLVADAGVCTVSGVENPSQLGGKVWAIAKGASLEAPDDFARWTVEPAPKYGHQFFVKDNTLYLMVKTSGLMILFK